ncbi:MAG: serine/threonine protein kinase [Fimbriimonadales bacterium]
MTPNLRHTSPRDVGDLTELPLELELPPETLVGDRYRIERTLGRGGFAIAYLAQDELADRRVVLKELAPTGSLRQDGRLRLPETTANAAHRIIHQFLREAKLLARLRIAGVVQIYDAFQENGTVYASMEFVENATTLESLLSSKGPLDPERVRTMLLSIAGTLHLVHAQGYLHRDIKPSNVLVLPGDQPVLIDFGAAREWQADATVSHTSLFTPGYAPIEQLSELGRRGPPTDIYSLAAMGYEMLVGIPPPSSVDRVSGATIRPVDSFRGDVPCELMAAINAGLALKAADRPATAAKFSQLLAAAAVSAAHETSDVERMDNAMLELKKLKVGRNECPSCGGLMDEPTPLKVGACPVCREGRIRPRNLDSRMCPVCRTGMLAKERNHDPMIYCPLCKFGRLAQQGLLRRNRYECSSCSATFTVPRRGELALVSPPPRPGLVEQGQTGTEVDFWLPLSGRSDVVFRCDGCNAQWDSWPSGDMKLVKVFEDPLGVAKKHRSLTSDEWARVAARLNLDAGNVVCDRCGADFYTEGDSLTLIDAEVDYFGFLAHYQGRRLGLDRLRWIAVGKASGHPGPACDTCDMEFDREGDYLRLRFTQNDELAPHTDQAWPFEDWHRLSRSLPTREDEPEFLERFYETLRKAVVQGELTPFSRRGHGLRWDAAAEVVTLEGDEWVTSAKGKLTLGDGMLEFAARKRPLKVPIDAIIDASAENDVLTLRLRGQSETMDLFIEPIGVRFDITSGRHELTLTAQDCAETITILRRELAGTKTPASE